MENTPAEKSRVTYRESTPGPKSSPDAETLFTPFKGTPTPSSAKSEYGASMTPTAYGVPPFPGDVSTKSILKMPKREAFEDGDQGDLAHHQRTLLKHYKLHTKNKYDDEFHLRRQHRRHLHSIDKAVATQTHTPHAQTVTFSRSGTKSRATKQSPPKSPAGKGVMGFVKDYISSQSQMMSPVHKESAHKRSTSPVMHESPTMIHHNTHLKEHVGPGQSIYTHISDVFHEKEGEFKVPLPSTAPQKKVSGVSASILSRNSHKHVKYKHLSFEGKTLIYSIFHRLETNIIWTKNMSVAKALAKWNAFVLSVKHEEVVRRWKCHYDAMLHYKDGCIQEATEEVNFGIEAKHQLALAYEDHLRKVHRGYRSFDLLRDKVAKHVLRIKWDRWQDVMIAARMEEERKQLEAEGIYYQREGDAIDAAERARRTERQRVYLRGMTSIMRVLDNAAKKELYMRFRIAFYKWIVLYLHMKYRAVYIATVKPLREHIAYQESILQRIEDDVQRELWDRKAPFRPTPVYTGIGERNTLKVAALRAREGLARGSQLHPAAEQRVSQSKRDLRDFLYGDATTGGNVKMPRSKSRLGKEYDDHRNRKPVRSQYGPPPHAATTSPAKNDKDKGGDVYAETAAAMDLYDSILHPRTHSEMIVKKKIVREEEKRRDSYRYALKQDKIKSLKTAWSMYEEEKGDVDDEEEEREVGESKSYSHQSYDYPGGSGDYQRKVMSQLEGAVETINQSKRQVQLSISSPVRLSDFSVHLDLDVNRYLPENARKPGELGVWPTTDNADLDDEELDAASINSIDTELYHAFSTVPSLNVWSCGK